MRDGESLFVTGGNFRDRWMPLRVTIRNRSNSGGLKPRVFLDGKRRDLRVPTLERMQAFGSTTGLRKPKRRAWALLLKHQANEVNWGT
jgi:hypothetical protein